jgi:hypothetical protein
MMSWMTRSASRSPVAWARLGRLSRSIAGRFPLEHPAVLVLSLPRSGSSWVGDMLGSAPDALYLREPLSQGDPAVRSRLIYDPGHDPVLGPISARLADKVFAGLPDFDERIVRIPGQWALKWRRPRRVVVKEVNPRACRWYLERYRPRVVFLIRHPAAVATSSQKQAWLGPTVGDWAQRGVDDGQLLREALTALAHHPESCTTVFFEDLCVDPLNGFRRLYDFAGLKWTGAVAERIVEYSHDSVSKIDAWRREASPEHVQALRRGYDQADLPWYRSDEEWEMGV